MKTHKLKIHRMKFWTRVMAVFSSHSVTSSPCIQEANKISQEQVALRERINKIEATLNGEEGWFLSFQRDGKGHQWR